MKSKSYFWTLLVGVVFLTTWEALVRALGTSELVMPTPSRIADVLWKSLVNGYLWPHIWQTLIEVFWGIVLGGLMGCVGGIVLGESKHLRSLLMPYVVLSQVIPKLALAPLFIVWFGFGVLPTVVMTSMQQVDPQKLELFKMLRANRWQTLWRLKIPSGMPNILAGFRVALVLAWVGAVVGEFIGSSKGLGALIIAAQGSMDTPLMFAVLVVITFLGISSYWMFQTFERRFLQS